MCLRFSLFLMFIVFLHFDVSAARIRMHKVKEAPRSCKTMQEDMFLSRPEKTVLATPRHSLLIEKNDQENVITLVKDKGEKVCQWTLDLWQSIQNENKLPDLVKFKFHIDEYKNNLYPYVKKADNSYFMMKIPIATCDLAEQLTTASLDIPKCEAPKKNRRPASRSKKKRTKSG